MKSFPNARAALRKIALFTTILFGFVSLLFSRDYGNEMHHIGLQKDTGIAHADAAQCSGSCNGGCGCDDCSSDSGDSAGDGDGDGK